MSAWTSADLTAIETAIGRGVKRVQYQDKTVEYQSLADMIRTRDMIRRDLAATAGTPKPVAGFGTMRRGFDE